MIKLLQLKSDILTLNIRAVSVEQDSVEFSSARNPYSKLHPSYYGVDLLIVQVIHYTDIHSPFQTYFPSGVDTKLIAPLVASSLSNKRDRMSH